MGTVGGPRHGSGRPALPGAGWQCPICGTLNVGDQPCMVCNDNVHWQRPMPTARPTGAQAARAAMAKVSTPPPEPLTDTREITLRVQATIGMTTQVLVQGPTGESYHGEGATLQEAVLSAIAALEEDEARPRCPTCGQHWPEDRDYPSAEELE